MPPTPEKKKASSMSLDLASPMLMDEKRQLTASQFEKKMKDNEARKEK